MDKNTLMEALGFTTIGDVYTRPFLINHSIVVESGIKFDEVLVTSTAINSMQAEAAVAIACAAALALGRGYVTAPVGSIEAGYLKGLRSQGLLEMGKYNNPRLGLSTYRLTEAWKSPQLVAVDCVGSGKQLMDFLNSSI